MTRWQTRLYDKNGRALNHDPSALIQTQDLPPVFEENSCLYLFTRRGSAPAPSSYRRAAHHV